MTHSLILATDLDGTFLGGSDDARQRLYDAIAARRAEMLLIFVTGRDLPFIRELCATTAVPWPDYVIGDVGTTIAGGDNLVPIEALEIPIAEAWGNRGDTVRAMLDGVPGLSLQATPFRYRVSYDYDPAAFDHSLVPEIEAKGFDVLISADRFLDVLPSGVAKGPTLLRLIDHLGIAPGRVLVAGDTLNDLSLFETGLTGVAVGNSEPALKRRLQGRGTVYHSQGAGAAGILEAIDHLQLLPELTA
ncbi:HAD family hydrolase [Pelagibius sp. 7325]|uniref:HAD family hydrolase n=1 Tax=Pelagibius sp. 7325 TaxID=3131994 RepID=UPI0030EC42E0